MAPVTYIALAINCIAVVGLVYLCRRESLRADRWEQLARSMARQRRSEQVRTVIAPEWHAPRAPSRLTALLDSVRDLPSWSHEDEIPRE